MGAIRHSCQYNLSRVHGNRNDLEGRQNPRENDVWIENTPMKRCGRPEELGPLALYLASDASSFMTGANILIDGGYTIW